jgi:hypothetical protein
LKLTLQDICWNLVSTRSTPKHKKNHDEILLIAFQLVHFDLFECVGGAAPDWTIRIKKSTNQNSSSVNENFEKIFSSFKEVSDLTLEKMNKTFCV